MHPDLSTLPMDIERECEACGKRYMVKRSDYVRGRRRFCSTACWYGPKVERTCEHCGKTFSVSPSTVARTAAKYCGRACLAAAKRSPDNPERPCSRCGETKPIEQFQKRGEYRVTFCNACHNERLRAKYDADPEYALQKKLTAHEYRRANPEHVAAKKKEWQQTNPHKVRTAVAQSRRRHPEHVAAREAMAEAVKSGALIRQPCWCGNPKTDGHHHKGYAPEHWLDVVWLCRKHHAELHRKYDPPADVA